MLIYTIGDILGIAALGAMLLIVLAAAAFRYVEQRLCKHEHYFETMACNAVCRNCGKNLGFIGTVRAARAAMGDGNDLR